MKIKPQNGVYEIEIGNSYLYSEENDILNIYNPNGQGAISISNYVIPLEYNFSGKRELLDFIHTIYPSAILEENNLMRNEHRCWAEFINGDNEYWKMWVYFKAPFAVFVSYNCDEKDRRIMPNEINDIVSSLTILNE